MKKIKLLLATMLSMMAWNGAMATVTQPTLTTDPSNPALYTIKSLRTGKYATYTGASSQLSQEANITKAALWFFEENGEGVSIIPAKDPTVKLAGHSSANETGAVWYLVENPYRAGYFCVTLSNNASSNCWDDQGNQTKIGYWQPSSNDNEGTSWIIESYDVENPVEVTYDVYDGETRLSSTTVLQAANSALISPLPGTGMNYNGNFHEKFYYDYAVSGTIGDTDCTITITRTEKAGVVKALSELSNNKAYNIGCDRGAMIAYDGKMVNTALNNATVNAQPYGKFALLQYEDNYYIFSVDENKFIKNDASVALDLTAAGFSTEDAIKIDPKTAPYFLLYFNKGGKNYGLNTNGNAPLGYVIDTWMNPDEGNQYYMVEAADFDPTDALAELDAYFHPAYYVTYVVKDEFGNTILTSEPQPAKAGAHITTLLDEFKRPFYTYNDLDITITEQNTTAEFTATWNGPFKLSENFENAAWQNMAVRGEWYVTSNNKNDEGALKTIQANAIGLVEDAYQWAFVGNGYDGFQVFNKAEGAEKVYVWKDKDNAIPEFIAATTENRWAIIKETRTEDKYKNAFMLTIPDTQYRQLNQNGGAGGPLKLWTASTTTDEGSAFTVFDVPTNFAEFVVNEIAPYVEPTGYFALNDLAKAEIGYDESYKIDCSFAQYKHMKEALQSMEDIKNYVLLPETGCYILKNKNYGTYMGIDPSDNNLYGNYTSVNNLKHIVTLARSNDDKYSLRIVGAYAPADVAQSAQVTAGVEEAFYTVSVPTVGYAAFQADPANNMSVLHCAGGGSIVGWEAPAAASQWEVIDAAGSKVEIALHQVGEEYYATLCVPFAYTVEGAKAYTLTFGEDDKLIPTEVTNVPAGTPVLVQGTNASATITIVGTEFAAEPLYPSNDNVLTGTYSEIEVNGNDDYFLGKKYLDYVGEGEDHVGFYHWSGTKLGANRAYLAASTIGAGVKGFVIDFGGEVGIRGIDQVLNGQAIYDLGGRKVQGAAQRGIYVVGGKKMVIK